MTNNLALHDLRIDVPGRTLFRGLDFSLQGGDSLAIVGPSGSGKTSLLTCLAGIRLPTSGHIVINGREITRMSSAQRAAFRLAHIGLIFQFGDLLPELTVVGNVALPLQLRGVSRRDAERDATSMLDRVGLGDRIHAKPESISGGEIQRVGIARALVNSPAVILADEPTGALDEANSIKITDLLLEQAQESCAAVIMSSHDPLVYKRAAHMIDLRELAHNPQVVVSAMS